MTASLSDIKEFHRSIGHALAHWQYVETGLYITFHCLLEARHELSSAVFFHIESARSTVSITNKLCKACLKQDTYQRHWLPIKKDANSAVDIRNALAHFELQGVNVQTFKSSTGRTTASPIILSPNTHDESASLDDGSVKALFLEDLHETSTWFRQIARDLLVFVATQVPDWQQRSTSLPPATRRLIAAIQSDTIP